jgi:hypothetical protein
VRLADSTSFAETRQKVEGRRQKDAGAIESGQRLRLLRALEGDGEAGGGAAVDAGVEVVVVLDGAKEVKESESSKVKNLTAEAQRTRRKAGEKVRVEFGHEKAGGEHRSPGGGQRGGAGLVAAKTATGL